MLFPQQPFIIGGPAVNVYVDDYNQDGNLDFTAIGGGIPRYVVWFGDGAGNFIPSTVGPDDVGSTWHSTSADFNGDGIADIFTTKQGNLSGEFNEDSLWLADGAGDFVKFPTLYGSRNGVAVTSGDFNNDGWPDVYAANFSEGRIYLNDGIWVKNEGGGSGSTCIIAAAFAGTPLSRELDTIRNIRDTYMLNNGYGIFLADGYYRFSVTVLNSEIQFKRIGGLKIFGIAFALASIFLGSRLFRL